MMVTAMVTISRNLKIKKTACGGSYICQDRWDGHKLHYGGLDWMLRKFFFHWKGVQTLEQPAQRGGIIISENGQGVDVELGDMS